MTLRLESACAGCAAMPHRLLQAWREGRVP
jgi:hypothetical protein